MSTDHKNIANRNTGRAIVIKDDHILLIERWRNDLHYFSIPGGKIEPEENVETTAIREVKEETDIDIELERLIYRLERGPNKHFIYLGNYLKGEPHIPPDAPEIRVPDPNNRYKPQWVPVSKLKSLDLGYWQPLHEQLVNDLKNGFEESVKITAA